MFNIVPISKLENKLLEQSDVQDITAGIQKYQDGDYKRILTAQDVKKDVSVLSRILIRAYVGWPFVNDIVKRRALKKLLKIYENAHDMTVLEFFDSLAPVVESFPDNHLRFWFRGRVLRTKQTRKLKNVGKNIAGDKTIFTELRPDNIAVIAFSEMLKTQEVADSLLQFKDKLNSSSALIVDLRDNTGGNSLYSDKLAAFLYGGPVRSAKKVYIRSTPEAQKLKPSPKTQEQPVLWKKDSKTQFNSNTGYDKPIYILIDGHTGSSAEMFVLRMMHHPRVKFVGDNSAGMEVYGDMAHAHLPNSNINISVGTKYRILEINNFELHGYKPDIMCDDNQDAFQVALNDYHKQQIILSRSGKEK